jgi:hypothetical protein
MRLPLSSFRRPSENSWAFKEKQHVNTYYNCLFSNFSLRAGFGCMEPVYGEKIYQPDYSSYGYNTANFAVTTD